jgi:capsular exopolysaccharide synthesis family protein
MYATVVLYYLITPTAHTSYSILKAVKNIVFSLPKLDKDKNNNEAPYTHFQIPKSTVAEFYRKFKTSLDIKLNFPKNNGIGEVVAIVSTKSEEGKTTIVENLAASYAYEGKKTIAIGADMRRPELFKNINLMNDFGLSDYLSGGCSLDKIITNFYSNKLDVIISGAIPPNPYELLKSKEYSDLLMYLQTKYEIILVDTPPLSPVGDGFEVAKLSDCVLFVTRVGRTQMTDFLMQLKLVERINPKVGVVINCDPNLPLVGHGFGYAGYGSYGV